MREKIENPVLESHLKSDLKVIGLPTDFTLEFRGYSKTYLGRYYVEKKKVVVYIHDVYGNEIPYHEILDTVLHEAIHHYQHHYDPSFVRLSGVMHNLDFKRVYNEKVSKLVEWEVLPCLPCY